MSSGCLHSFKNCCPPVYSSLHSRCRKGKGNWQDGKKRETTFSLCGGLLNSKGKGKGFCMSVLTPCLPFISQITDFGQINIGTDGIRRFQNGSSDFKVMRMICIGNSMICSDIWHKYHE